MRPTGISVVPDSIFYASYQARFYNRSTGLDPISVLPDLIRYLAFTVQLTTLDAESSSARRWEVFPCPAYQT